MRTYKVLTEVIELEEMYNFRSYACIYFLVYYYTATVDVYNN